ncbi:MAG: hypothetical protein CR980_01060 [Propionibacteriales bacterium]|nr:MAG: hypothetical protein CR980_01060 [Propionibacteriales bacterium]
MQDRDSAAFLPSSAEATKAKEWQEKFIDQEVVPGIMIIESDEQLSPRDAANLIAKLEEAKSVVGKVVGPIPSQDGKALQLIVPADPDLKTAEVGDELREILAEAVPDFPGDARGYLTGPVGFLADLVEAFSGIDGLLLIVAMATVLIILLVVYRSILLPITVLLTATGALTAAIVAVYYMAKWGWITLDGQSQGILSILVIGAATDYALLFVARFREALTRGLRRVPATWAAVRGAIEPILASAGTVIAGLMCLLLSDLNSNRALGPIAASGIVFSVLAALTLLPAFLVLLGRAAFWPFMPKPVAEGADATHETAKRSIWYRIAKWVEAKPRPIWIVTAIVLLVAAAGVTQLRATGVEQSELVLRETQSSAGQDAIARHYDSNTGTPAFAIVDADQAEDAIEAATATEGVDSATLTAADGGPMRPGAKPKEVEGRVLVSIVLNEASDADESGANVQRLRDELHKLNPEILVGGRAAIAYDTQVTSRADLMKIIPMVLIAILVILMLLLRSIVAPIILIVTTIISYGSAMGVSALVFNHLFEFSGADSSVPLFGFVFLVALGVDYNIFLATRVREEALTRPPREAITTGLAVTGGVITSAGVVLAATFASLSVIPIMFMVQLGFIVAFGVLLDTLVVRTLLVPALGHELGRKFWWPSRISRATPVSQ